MNYLKRQEGLALPLAIGLVAIIAIVVGVAIYQFGTARTASVTPSPTPTFAKPSDSELIARAVANYDAGSHNDAVSNLVIVDSNAKGTATSHGTPSGYEFIAHKDSDVWTIVYKGQEKPGNGLGKKYALPADWYATSY